MRPTEHNTTLPVMLGDEQGGGGNLHHGDTTEEPLERALPESTAHRNETGQEQEGSRRAQISEDSISGSERLPHGYVQHPVHVALRPGQYMVPDSAQNNAFCMVSSAFIYRKCQEMNIPLIILSRHTADVCPVTKFVYDSLKATNSVVGHRLHRAQRSSIESLWKRANLPAGDQNRKTLPTRCNRKWFCDTFCGGVDPEGKDVWDYIRSFSMCDPLALLVTIPALRERFFEPKIVRIKQTDHTVVGFSPTEHGVREVAPLHQFLLKGFFHSLTIDLIKAEDVVLITDPGQDQDDEMALVITRDLMHRGLINCRAGPLNA